MITKNKARAFAALASMSLALLMVGPVMAKDEAKKKEFAADKGPTKVDVSTFPADVQANYKVFAARCSKCHTLARPINTDMSTNGWKMYVKRMMNKPDSGISPANGKKIYKFLKVYQKAKNALKAKSEEGKSKKPKVEKPKAKK